MLPISNVCTIHSSQKFSWSLHGHLIDIHKMMWACVLLLMMEQLEEEDVKIPE
jgi:hypothetical protein